jgi:hypothetical protein
MYGTHILNSQKKHTYRKKNEQISERMRRTHQMKVQNDMTWVTHIVIRWVEEILHQQKDGWNMLRSFLNNGINQPSKGAYWFLNHPQYVHNFPYRGFLKMGVPLVIIHFILGCFYWNKPDPFGSVPLSNFHFNGCPGVPRPTRSTDPPREENLGDFHGFFSTCSWHVRGFKAHTTMMGLKPSIWWWLIGFNVIQFINGDFFSSRIFTAISTI